jgi:SAM dependent carboxyl methyltransferase
MHEKCPERFTQIDKPFVVAEYGCATGYSSIETLSTIIKEVKMFNEKLHITIYLNDLPENHHTIAIKTVSAGLFGKDSTLSESERANVFIYVAGHDFTKPVFPKQFVDFGFSNMAANTLSNSPSPLTNCYFFASDKVVATEGGQKWVQAFEDFIARFMQARSSELKTGGIMCMVTQTYVPQDANFTKHHLMEESYYQGLYNLIRDIFT